MLPPKVPNKEEGEGPAASLAELPVDVLTAVLDGEQTHTVVLVLNSLPMDLAGPVLQRLPPEVRRLVPVWINRQGGPNHALLDRIAERLGARRNRWAEGGRPDRARGTKRSPA